MDTPSIHEIAAESSTWSPPLPPASGFDHLVVEAPGLRMHVAALGEGEPVILLHGFPAHWWQWRDIAPAIAAAGYRVLCPDLRGAGWSVADEPGIDRDAHLRDLLALLDLAGIERAHLLAHDLGAIGANQLAYAHPERVKSLVQLSVPPLFMRMSPKLAGGFRHMPRLIWHRRGRSLAGLFDPGQPTLAVFGLQDHPWDEPVIRRLSGDVTRYADRFEFAFVDDAAHFITDDAPGRVTALALRWFAENDAHVEPANTGRNP